MKGSEPQGGKNTKGKGIPTPPPKRPGRSIERHREEAPVVVDARKQLRCPVTHESREEVELAYRCSECGTWYSKDGWELTRGQCDHCGSSRAVPIRWREDWQDWEYVPRAVPRWRRWVRPRWPRELIHKAKKKTLRLQDFAARNIWFAVGAGIGVIVAVSMLWLGQSGMLGGIVILPTEAPTMVLTVASTPTLGVALTVSPTSAPTQTWTATLTPTPSNTPTWIPTPSAFRPGVDGVEIIEIEPKPGTALSAGRETTVRAAIAYQLASQESAYIDLVFEKEDGFSPTFAQTQVERGQGTLVLNGEFTVPYRASTKLGVVLGSHERRSPALAWDEEEYPVIGGPVAPTTGKGGDSVEIVSITPAEGTTLLANRALC